MSSSRVSAFALHKVKYLEKNLNICLFPNLLSISLMLTSQGTRRSESEASWWACGVSWCFADLEQVLLMCFLEGDGLFFLGRFSICPRGLYHKC